MESALNSWCASFVRDANQEKGAACAQWLQQNPLSSASSSKVPDTTIRTASAHHDIYAEFLESFLLMQKYSHEKEPQDIRCLDTGCFCLKKWIDWYCDEEGRYSKNLWMLPVLQYFTSAMWKFCRSMDVEKSQEGKYLKKLVEVFREQYRKLLSERTKMEGCVWITCELLRAYFQLGQVGQCPFLLKSLEQSLNSTTKTQTQGGGTSTFTLSELPKSIGVTFAYYWGRMCVYENNVTAAEEKLSWAFANTPPNMPQKRRILQYLVPCRLRLGILPSDKLLKRYDLVDFLDICKAIRSGNIRLFQEHMGICSADFVKQGTFVIMSRLIHIVYQTLVKRVTAITQEGISDAKLRSRLDLMPFERALKWQDQCTPGETQVILANLLYFGAIKGYLSNDHRKMVLARDNPFPPTSKWQRF
eukprot:GEMP01035915.1.p1 GENE.GEMP01035915.1~~GEMP01035915.1.p1  ORF type:complete len:416 (+),score=81.93 GEMP01035915.1:207-1454(+)